MHDEDLDVPVLWNRPGWARTLSNLYWRLRNVRRHDMAGRRKWYRYIRAERDYLVEHGVDAELVRLACRYLSNPLEGPALSRLVAFELVVERLNAMSGNQALRQLSKRNICTFTPDREPRRAKAERQRGMAGRPRSFETV